MTKWAPFESAPSGCRQESIESVELHSHRLSYTPNGQLHDLHSNLTFTLIHRVPAGAVLRPAPLRAFSWAGRDGDYYSLELVPSSVWLDGRNPVPKLHARLWLSSCHEKIRYLGVETIKADETVEVAELYERD